MTTNINDLENHSVSDKDSKISMDIKADKNEDLDGDLFPDDDLMAKLNRSGKQAHI